ncbi:MAG: hypothetical protein NZ693_04450 [Thermoflexales bacterium]|nr:hypothetical protein [Thermoflexales bacterium]
MGTFAVWRGEQCISEEEWARPAVVRLFQFLALHRGKQLRVEEVLGDLDLGEDRQGRRLLQRLLSWLKQVLEPCMRPRGPLRYVRAREQHLL